MNNRIIRTRGAFLTASQLLLVSPCYLLYMTVDSGDGNDGERLAAHESQLVRIKMQLTFPVQFPFVFPHRCVVLGMDAFRERRFVMFCSFIWSALVVHIS